MAYNNAWYLDASEENPTELHKTEPPRYLDSRELLMKAGVRYEQVPESVCDDKQKLQALSIERNYVYFDYVTVDGEMAEKFHFKDEHLHDDPEIRLVLDGSGFFDVRTVDNEWVRIHLKKGDLLTLPPGIWHRFLFDQHHHIKLFRLFSETPQWTAEYRARNPNPAARSRYQTTMSATS